MVISDLAAEWRVLQVQFDEYEKYSLIIKLFNILLCCIAVVANLSVLPWGLLTVLVWLTDAIWKTFQSRIESRLLDLEQAIAEQLNSEAQDDIFEAYQFNRQFAAVRPSALGLIAEYVRQAIRPTVAFPHAALLILIPIMSL